MEYTSIGLRRWLAIEYREKNSGTIFMNIENLSNIIEKHYSVSSHIIRDYIFASIGMGLARNNELYNEIDNLYLLDSYGCYSAAANSHCIKHVIMKQGKLKQEIYARKLVGILLIAEEDYILRGKVIKLLRKCYPHVYRSVKKRSKKELKTRYMQMDELTRNIEARLDAAVYFYFAVYCSADETDQGYILSIIEDISNFQLYSPMTTDIDNEINKHRKQIDSIKALINEKFGEINGYKDIINSDKDEIDDLGGMLENLFMINKIDVKYIFRNLEILDIDKIILAYVKRGYKKPELDIILQGLVSGVFMQSLINEYNEAKNLYFENNQELVNFKLNASKEKLSYIEDENKELKLQLEVFQQEKKEFNEKLTNQINKLNKSFKAETSRLRNRIKELENQLVEEEKYRSELNVLREYIFELKNEYAPHDTDKTLDHYIADKNILIIGGAKSWRRKFREKYPKISTMNGFNDNFDINILNNIDYIFFYTGYMNHSAYNKAMGFIRAHQLKFGYIGKTNIELVEEEIIDELQRCRMGRRLSLSD